MALEIAIKEVDGISVISLVGTMTTGTTLSIAEAKIVKLIDSGNRRAVLDLSQVSYCDSGGLGMLVSVAGSMDSQGGKLRIAGGNEKLARTFKLTHTDNIFLIDTTVEDALQHFRHASATA